MIRYAVRVIVWTTVIIAMALVLWRPALRLIFPFPYASIVHQAALANEVDPLLVVALMRTESHFDPSAVSPRGARGLMQVMPDTAVWVAEQLPLPTYTIEQIHDPATNIALGTWYIRFLLGLFDQNTPLAIAAYNAGPGTVQRWLDDGVWSGSLQKVDAIPYDETRQYVQKVVNGYRLYRQIHSNSHPGYNDLIQ